MCAVELCISMVMCLCILQELLTMTKSLMSTSATCIHAKFLFMRIYMSTCTTKVQCICEYFRGLHTSLCLSYVCKPFVVASIALLLHTHMFFMGWLMELSSSCLCDVVYCCLMCSGILHRRAPRADLIT